MTIQGSLPIKPGSGLNTQALDIGGELDQLRQEIQADKALLDISLQLALTKSELVHQYAEKAKRNEELVIANNEKANLEILNTEKLRTSLMETIGIARQLVELRDPYTAGHEQHVGDLAKAIAAQMGLDEGL